MATNTDRKWNKRMTIEEMIPLMSDAEIAANARKGGTAAIAEQQRRIAKKQTAWDKTVRAMGVIPDHPLDLGV